MASQNEIIIEVEVSAGKSAEELANVRARIDQLKDAQKKLKTEMKALQDIQIKGGKISENDAKTLAELNRQYATNTADLKQLTAEEKMYSNQIAIATQNDRKYGDSITELGAQLAQLKAEYRSLSAAQRKSAEGKAMLENIQTLDKAVKDADYSLGDFQRNVGNYQSALLGLNGNVLKVSQLFAGGFKNSLAAAGQAVKSFGKMLLTTPIGWISAAVGTLIAVFNKLKDAFKSNDTAGTQLAAALARLQPIADAIGKVFAALAETVAKLVNGVTQVATVILSKLIPSYNDAAQAAYRLKIAQDELQESERQYVVNHAKYQAQIADLQAKAAQRDKYTREQRLQFYDESIELERKDLAEKRKIAVEKYNEAVIAAKQQLHVSVITAEAYNRLDDSIKDNLANLKAAYISIDAEMSDFMRSQQKRRQGVIKEMDAEGKQQAEAARRNAQEAAKAAEQAKQTELDEMRKLEDLKNAMIEDEAERQRATVRATYTRQVEDLKKRLQTETNLTEDAKKSLNGQIELLEEQMWKELSDIDTAELAKNNERIEKLAEEARKRQVEAEKLAEQQKEEAKRKIREDYDREALEIANDYQRQLNAVYGNAAEQARIEAERVSAYYKELTEMGEETYLALYGSEEAYKAAVLKSEEEMMKARETAANAMQNQAKELASIMQTMTGALSDLFEAAAGDSEQYEKFKKAIAIVDATISMASAIAAATAVSTEGEPYTMALRITANVEAVTAQFAAVLKALKAAQIPSAGSYSGGGIVPGTSYNGDRLTANVNSREMILTQRQQAHLFDMIQAGAPQSGIDYGLMAAAMAAAVSRLPAPVLDYSEFTRFQRKVKMIERKVTL